MSKATYARAAAALAAEPKVDPLDVAVIRRASELRDVIAESSLSQLASEATAAEARRSYQLTALANARLEFSHADATVAGAEQREAIYASAPGELGAAESVRESARQRVFRHDVALQRALGQLESIARRRSMRAQAVVQLRRLHATARPGLLSERIHAT